jgi:hypothetical protein
MAHESSAMVPEKEIPVPGALLKSVMTKKQEGSTARKGLFFINVEKENRSLTNQAPS